MRSIPRLVRLVLLPLTLAVGGCATYGGSGPGVRTWQEEPIDTIFRGPPHERIQVVSGNRLYRLEGARLEADSVIGFWEDDGRWRRVAFHREDAGKIEVKKLNLGLTALWAAANTALMIVGGAAGR